MTAALEQYKAQHGEVEQDALALIEDINGFEITTPAESVFLLDISSTCAKRIKVVEAERKLIADPLHKSWKATNVFFKKFRSPWEQAKTLADTKVKAFLRQQQEEQAKAQRLAIAAAQAAQDALAAAEEAETPEEAEEAAEELQEAQVVSREALMAAVAPTQGLGGGHQRSNWKARVVDMKTLVLWVAEAAAKGDEGPLALLEPNLKLLHAEAKSLAVAGDICPGVEAWDDFSVVGGR